MTDVTNDLASLGPNGWEMSGDTKYEEFPGGGATAFTALTDAATVDLAAINPQLAADLAAATNGVGAGIIGSSVTLNASNTFDHKVWAVGGNITITIDASLAAGGATYAFKAMPGFAFNVVPAAELASGWSVEQAATANSADAVGGWVVITSHIDGRFSVSSRKWAPAWNSTATALLKPDGSEVVAGAYLGEFLWSAKPNVATAPAFSRWLCTTTYVEYIRNAGGTEWLPLGTAVLSAAYTAAHTGTTTATNIFDSTVLAGLLTGRRVRLCCDLGKTGVAGNAILSLRYGATDLIVRTFAASTLAANIDQVVFFGGASQQVTGALGMLPGGYESASGVLMVGAENSAVDKALQLRLQLGNAADSVRLNYSITLER